MVRLTRRSSTGEKSYFLQVSWSEQKDTERRQITLLDRNDIAIIISALETAKVAVETSKKLEPDTKTEFLNKLNATITKVVTILKELKE